LSATRQRLTETPMSTRAFLFLCIAAYAATLAFGYGLFFGF
jgi:hypothetical protein